MNSINFFKFSSPTRFLSRLGLFAAVLLLLNSCSSISVEEYSNQKPNLRLSEYFNGNINAYGIFTDRSGKVVKRFTVVIKGSWENKNGRLVGTLDESFTYSDGSTDKRIWTITETSPNQYVGTASDVKGQATGRASGNALNWTYTLNLPVDKDVYEVQFNDWMYLINDKVMLNRATMSKFGIYLGEVTLSFHKP